MSTLRLPIRRAMAPTTSDPKPAPAPGPAAPRTTAFDERSRRAAVAKELAPSRPSPASVTTPNVTKTLHVAHRGERRATLTPDTPTGRRSELRRLLAPVDLPAVFIGDIRPLAIGVREALVALLPAATSYGVALRLKEKRRGIARWLRAYAARPEYLEALAAPESQRHALDGSPAGPVADEHREHARTLLAGLDGAK